MIASPNYSARGSSPVRLVVVHTAEGSRTKESLGRYFQGNVGASSHVGIDAGGIEQYVDYSNTAWTLLNGNPISDNAELCAFARWTRDQWMSTGTVDGCVSPRAILDNTAAWIRDRCNARGIPIRKLSPAQVDQGMSGVIGHADWSYSNVGQGDHTDPGSNFPWDYVIARAAGMEGEDDMAGELSKLGLEQLFNTEVQVTNPFGEPDKAGNLPTETWKFRDWIGLAAFHGAYARKEIAELKAEVEALKAAKSTGGA